MLQLHLKNSRLVKKDCNGTFAQIIHIDVNFFYNIFFSFLLEGCGIEHLTIAISHF